MKEGGGEVEGERERGREKEREIDREVRVREGENKREKERERERERWVEREGNRETERYNIQRAMLMLCSRAGGHSLRLLCVRSALSPHFCCCFHVLLRACQQ